MASMSADLRSDNASSDRSNYPFNTYAIGPGAGSGVADEEGSAPSSMIA
jgi:hypothetical protein